MESRLGYYKAEHRYFTIKIKDNLFKNTKLWDWRDKLKSELCISQIINSIRNYLLKKACVNMIIDK